MLKGIWKQRGWHWWLTRVKIIAVSSWVDEEKWDPGPKRRPQHYTGTGVIYNLQQERGQSIDKSTLEVGKFSGGQWAFCWPLFFCERKMRSSAENQPGEGHWSYTEKELVQIAILGSSRVTKDCGRISGQCWGAPSICGLRCKTRPVWTVTSAFSSHVFVPACRCK